MIDSDNGSIPLLAIRLCSTTGYITHWLYSPKLLPLIKKRIKVIQMGEDNIMIQWGIRNGDGVGKEDVGKSREGDNLRWHLS